MLPLGNVVPVASLYPVLKRLGSEVQLMVGTVAENAMGAAQTAAAAMILFIHLKFSLNVDLFIYCDNF